MIKGEDEQIEYAFHSEVRKLHHHLLGYLRQDKVNDEAAELKSYLAPLLETPRAPRHVPIPSEGRGFRIAHLHVLV
jgi:hypothetical protein